MNSKKGIASIVTILILISLSVGIGLSAYFLSEKLKQPPNLIKLEQEEESQEEKGIALPNSQTTEKPQVHFSVPQASPSPTTATSATPSPSPVIALQTNFKKTGVTLDWDVATETNTNIWRFLWDEPGALALTVNLEFNQQSQCNLGSGYQACDKSKLVNGDTAEVEGNRSGDKVTVIKLKKL